MSSCPDFQRMDSKKCDVSVRFLKDAVVLYRFLEILTPRDRVLNTDSVKKTLRAVAPRDLQGRYDKRTRSKKSPAIQTAGKILPDGMGLELFRDPSDPEQLWVLSWRDEGLQISINGRRSEPVRVDSSFAEALRFPFRVAPPGSTKELFTDKYGLLRCYPETMERQCSSAQRLDL